MRIALLGVAFAVLSACGGSSAVTPSPSASGRPPPPPASPSGSPTPSASQSATPEPVCYPIVAGNGGSGSIFDVSTGDDNGADRLVIGLTTILTYDLRVNPDGTNFRTTFSGVPVTVAGTFGVTLRIFGLVAGEDLFPHGTDIHTGLPTLQEVRLLGDGEGRADFALGLNRAVCPRIAELSGPPRLVLDF